MSSYLKNLYQIAALVSMAAFLLSCGNKKSKENVVKVVSDSTLQIKSKIEVTLIGKMEARRTFADIQFIEDEKERDKYIEKQERNGPDIFSADSLIVAGFERIGLMKNGELLDKKFKSQKGDTLNFSDSAGRNLRIKFFWNEHTRFKIFYSSDSIEIDTDAYNFQPLNYAFLDVIPGGNKELVFLDNWYIMNGYNFDFKVYSIKINN